MQAEVLVNSFDRVGVETTGKDWSWLWKPLEGENGG